MSCMPRLPRCYIVPDNSSVHKVWRGHNKEFNLELPEWKEKYLEILEKELEKSRTVYNAFTLMDNHVHEIVQAMLQKDFSELMRRHHSKYGAYFNREQNRSGKVAEDRPKTCLLEDDRAFMEVTFYVHANPHRSKMLRSLARNYLYSTHRLYAYGKRDPWTKFVRLPDWYMRLGKTYEQRRSKYRKLFEAYLRSKGLEKDPKFSKPFYGSPLWILENKLRLKTLIAQKGKDPPVQ